MQYLFHYAKTIRTLLVIIAVVSAGNCMAQESSGSVPGDPEAQAIVEKADRIRFRQRVFRSRC